MECRSLSATEDAARRPVFPSDISTPALTDSDRLRPRKVRRHPTTPSLTARSLPPAVSCRHLNRSAPRRISGLRIPGCSGADPHIRFPALLRSTTSSRQRHYPACVSASVSRLRRALTLRPRCRTFRSVTQRDMAHMDLERALELSKSWASIFSAPCERARGSRRYSGAGFEIPLNSSGRGSRAAASPTSALATSGPAPIR